ncbi:hypothetical protein Q5P01_018293 [Channa striata]|uniref:Homeobox domain-containing protein n=1 Tax=Channa striata TaxID=64152 RepID=A0AA88S9M9_CHASR|nr:hypothetical protein Q5P01_018293 [Channa striata]
MYQLPVGNIEKIRKARKAVKSILSEIGLEDCQNLLKDLNEKTEKNANINEVFRDTEWVDFSDGHNSRLRKKWPYRSRSLCCSLCKYSSQNIYNFRSHVSRCHGDIQAYCALTPCSQCLFISHPRAVKKHMLYFHSKLPIHAQLPREASLPTHRGNERYQCRRCGFPTSSIFALKKHIILKHLDILAEQYIGYRLHLQGPTSSKIYCCKVCKVNTGNLDQMLHHMLVDPSHYSVSTQVQGMIHENKNYTIKPTPNGNGVFVTFPSIAPKPQQGQMFSSKPVVLPSANGQPARTVVALQPLQGNANSATLICAPGTNQAFLPPQASALVQLASAEAKGLLQPGATISLQSALPQVPSMVQLPTVSNVSLKQAQLALAPASAQVQHPPQTQQILVPSGLQANVAAGTGAVPKPAVVTQNAPTNNITLQGTMLTSQSLLSHLIPTGNRLLEHVKQHNPTSKAYCDFLRQKYRVYSKGIGGILFPYFDVNTTAPKEVLGDTEVNLALVTNSLDLIFFKLQPNNQPEICPAPVKLNSPYCPFCDEKFENESKHHQHLKQKHFVAPTIHAILKIEAFKCIYCNGVYTGKITQQAVMLHIQRCRCSPKPPQPPKPAPPPPPQQPPKPVQQLTQPSGLYFLQVPQGLTMKQTLAPARVITAAPTVQAPETEAEMQCKKRLEAAWKQVIEANKREREERAAIRKKREQEKFLPPPEPEIQSDPAVKLMLEPTPTERRCSEERRDYISKYFNLNPYATKAETDELCRRLSLTKAELAALFSKKRSKCMKSLKKNTTAVLLGFNMTELSKLKHNLLIPEQQPAEPTEQLPAVLTEQKENTENRPEPMDESGKEGVTDGQVEQM